jgi:hypothetical protein
MSNDENFLARWSRRKRDATRNSRDRPKPADADGGAPSDAAAVLSPLSESQPLFDPTSLPPIESLGAGSDIRAFLAAGVPAALTRAALRRVWSADPAIRDFIGLSENSWDFNAPGGVPGFGAVTAEEIRRLVTQVIGEPETADRERSAAEPAAADQTTAPMSASGRASPAAVQKQLKQNSNAGVDRRELTQRSEANAAVQHGTTAHEYYRLPRRGHGGALPK